MASANRRPYSPREARDQAWATVAVTGTLFAAVVIASIAYGTHTSAIRATKEPQSIARPSSAPSTTGQGGDERSRPLIVR
jgi:hypothetical protein